MLRQSENALVDSPQDSPTPASGTSLDLSQALASIFKHLYAKQNDRKILANLSAKKMEEGDYHQKLSEELEKVQMEHNQTIETINMLERHISDASEQAAERENEDLKRMKEAIGENSKHEDLIAVEAAFPLFVNNDLLHNHNLISPRDYLPKQKTRVKPPPPIKHDPAKPTISFLMLINKAPPDGSSPVLPSTDKNIPDLGKSKGSPESCISAPKTRNLNIRKPRQKWKEEASEKDIERLKYVTQGHYFLRNPRFLPPSAQQSVKPLLLTKAKEVKMDASTGKEADRPSLSPLFVANPQVVVFTNYSVGRMYEVTLELKNVTASSRHVRVIAPTTPHFSISLGKFPGDCGVVAPGMCCKYIVRFTPDSLSYFEDYIVVESQAEQELVVPITARRPPPVLSLPRVLDCGCCLIGGVKFVEFYCENIGLSPGTFCIMPKKQWPASNLRSMAHSFFSEQPPFAISPSLFALEPKEAITVEVVFFPSSVERSSQTFTVVCDNCEVKDICIQGEGQCIALELLSDNEEKNSSVKEEVHDLTAEHFIRFDPCNPHAAQHKKLVVRNNVHLELPFHWQVMNPNLPPLPPEEFLELHHLQFHQTSGDVFSISPETGILAPCQDQEFVLTFFPKELKDYHSVCHLVLRDVPELPQELSDNSGLQTVRTGSKVNDVIAMEIEVKGSTEPFQILLEPYAVIIPGEHYILTTFRRQFRMWNNSKTRVVFKWERISDCHIIEVEPPTGKIEENECFDFLLLVTGGKPEKVATSLVCNVEHHPDPIKMYIEVAFKGPTVTTNTPTVDFGLLKLGEKSQTTLLFTNTTHLEASWSLEEIQNNQPVKAKSQILLEPRRGVLPPLGSCYVNVVFTPVSCQHFKSELQLSVKNGTGCNLLLQADVQSPHMCLLNCELALSGLYVGVQSKGAVTLYNQTLLPSKFSWKAKLQGRQASLCTTSFEPSSGSLGPNARQEITVHFTTHTDVDLTDIAALCDVEGVNTPLVLRIMASKTKTLSISYSLPSSDVNNPCPSTLMLDFGEDVVLNRPVTRQLMMTNHTAISAVFALEAEYFICNTSKPNNHTEKRYSKKPLHSVQAKRIEEKEQKEFVDNLLANGKGAAFLIQPKSGTLGPFATQTVEVTAYSEMWGEYRDNLICKAGTLEPTVIPMQMTVKGCPLYFQMTGPRPDDQNQGPILQFGTHLSGGDTVSRSLRINNPSMFDIRMDWETYNIEDDNKQLVDVLISYGETFPLKDADGNEVIVASSEGPPRNAGTTTHAQTVCTDSSCSTPKSLTDMVEESKDGDDSKTPLYTCPAGKQLFSIHIRPHVGKVSDYPYCITPQQIVIKAKSSSTIYVSFTPLTLLGSDEARCVGRAHGYMSLDLQRAVCVPGKVVRTQALEVDPVRIDFHAIVKPAVLVHEIEGDMGVLEFYATSSDLLKGGPGRELQDFTVTESFQLKNTTEMPLYFNLETQPPFSVLKQQPRARNISSSQTCSSHSQYLVVQPKYIMQVKVTFHCSVSFLDYADRVDDEVPPWVSLIRSESGQRKLRFQQNLLIHYSNDSLQSVPLCAYLSLMTLRLSPEHIDFGACYVGQPQTKEVILHSDGASSWKSVIESDTGDSGVFEVLPDIGFLKYKKVLVPTYSQRLQISFTASEDREFKATVVIRSPLVKTPLILQLQGTGSLDEELKSEHSSLWH
ncbi:deleted in lung and esophageal cancer protein 1 isoform X1 [Synchiropus splendidus]|uniref:deleted in lung and esophageal cancer protein 1 isoform X1 n=1 Tax=Synchiropus splendidus TaxID=270530 RepID=UPI00237E0A55|nr:deleted in lung and esophageal cancer protein 1 isoform X1 [Synchiropus splendidus]